MTSHTNLQQHHSSFHCSSMKKQSLSLSSCLLQWFRGCVGVEASSLYVFCPHVFLPDLTFFLTFQFSLSEFLPHGRAVHQACPLSFLIFCCCCWCLLPFNGCHFAYSRLLVFLFPTLSSPRRSSAFCTARAAACTTWTTSLSGRGRCLATPVGAHAKTRSTKCCALPTKCADRRRTSAGHAASQRQTRAR